MTSVASLAFPGEARLRTPRQFQTAFSQGRRISTPPFRLHFLPADPQAGHAKAATERMMSRLGISVPKRIASDAVVRNRIKRVVRESFRHIRMQLPQGDYVLLAQREAATATPQALREALSALWQRAPALKQSSATPTMPPARAGTSGEIL